MRIWGKLVAAAVAPLMLTGCLWGRASSRRTWRCNKAGTFVLDYRGEIMLQMPDDKGAPPAPWSDKMAACYTDGERQVSTTDGRRRPSRRRCRSSEATRNAHLHARRNRQAEGRI